MYSKAMNMRNALIIDYDTMASAGGTIKLQGCLKQTNENRLYQLNTKGSQGNQG
jgi:hypothetical protein